MSKKSKKILAYLMFVAALCGTPAVSEARGGSGGQVKTEKASGAQRGGNLSESIFSYFVRNYGPEFAKAIFYSGGGFGTAKMLKAGDLSTWASYLFDMKSADLKKAKKLMEQYDAQKAVFDKEKKDFNVQRAKALEDNGKLIGDKNALELKVNAFNKQVDENKKEIEKLKGVNQVLNEELSGEKEYNKQLNGIIEKNSKNLNVLLSSVIDSKMSGEFVGSYSKEEGYWNSYEVDKLILEPFSIENVVRVALVEYDADGNVFGEAEKIELGTDDFLNNVKSKAEEKLSQNATGEDISLADFGLGDFGVPGLARYSFAVKKDGKLEKVVAAYFPLKSAQENVENNNNENNENDNINENENENIENNENVNNENDN